VGARRRKRPPPAPAAPLLRGDSLGKTPNERATERYPLLARLLRRSVVSRPVRQPLSASSAPAERCSAAGPGLRTRRVVTAPGRRSSGTCTTQPPSSRLASGRRHRSLHRTHARCAVASHEKWRIGSSDTATLCLASLLGLSLLSALVALALAGSWRSLELYLRDELVRSLIAAPHVLFVLLATAPRRHSGQSSITRWRFWIKRQLFFLLKTLQVCCCFSTERGSMPAAS